MVNKLSGSVSAYRQETTKRRYIRIDEVMELFDVTHDEAMDITLAAGARYQLSKIILVHKERLMKYMKHFTRIPSPDRNQLLIDVCESSILTLPEARRSMCL